MIASVSRPAVTASATSCWPRRKPSKPKTDFNSACGSAIGPVLICLRLLFRLTESDCPPVNKGRTAVASPWLKYLCLPASVGRQASVDEAAGEVRDEDVAGDEHAGVRQHPSHRAVDGFKQAVQPVPDAGDEGLAQVQDLEVDQPGQDDVHDHDEEGDIKQKLEDLENREDHGGAFRGLDRGYLGPVAAKDKLPPRAGLTRRGAGATWPHVSVPPHGPRASSRPPDSRKDAA